MSPLSAQIETYRQSAAPAGPSMLRPAAVEELIDVGLGLYETLLKSVMRDERRGIDPQAARSYHEQAGALAEAFAALLQIVKQARASGQIIADADRLEEAWRELIPAAQFSYDRLAKAAKRHVEQRELKTGAEVRDGLRGQVHGGG